MPKGLRGSTKLARCGIEPARKRESNVDVELGTKGLLSPVSLENKDDDLNGLAEGVGLEVLGGSDAGLMVPEEAPASAGENLEGTVPARARRAGLWELLSDGGIKSGNPSWLGDSGMVSLSGVEPPLAGGPHIGVRPS